MSLIELQHNRPVRIVGAARIECIAGNVWVTRTRVAGDVFLHPGDSCPLDGADWALAEALGTATVRVRSAPAAWRQALKRAAGVLSSAHGRLRTVRFNWWRTPLAG